MTTIFNIAGYKFISLNHLPVLQADMLAAMETAGVLGTILLADEGINVALAGSETAVGEAKEWFSTTPCFNELWLKETTSSFTPFAKLKIKIRHEIIAFDGGRLQVQKHPAPTMSPNELKRWLDDGRNFTLLDTRNSYEVKSGSFVTAESLDINTFRDFQLAAGQLDPRRKTTPVVTFCTGGVRCEKAAPWLIEQGFEEVYQVEGGILNYFQQCGGAHWEGDCFVFDDRVEVDPNLNETGAALCTNCHRAVSADDQSSPLFVPGISCPHCFLATATV